jgi:apolipoprotein N-acyltransferase
MALPVRFPRWTALIAGGASATGFAPLGLWPVALIAFALLLHLVSIAPRGRDAALIGWLFGVGHFTIGNNWIATAFTYQAAMPAWLGWIAVVLLALYLAVYPMLAAMLACWASQFLNKNIRRSREGGNPTPDGAMLNQQGLGRVQKHATLNTLRGDDVEGVKEHGPTLPFILLFAAAWIVTEWLRSWVFTGFAWNPLSAMIADIGHVAIWIGTYGLSGLVCMGAGVVLLLVKKRWWQSFAIVLLFAGMFSAAYISIWAEGFDRALSGSISKGPDWPGPPAITIVQPNNGQGDKYDLTQQAANFARLARLSPREANQPPRLLLWPEAAVPDYLESGYPLSWYNRSPAEARARLAALLGARDVMLTGAVALEANADRSDVAGARNSLFALDATGRLLGRYDKSHLVPYGEYLPMRGLLEPLGLSRLVPGDIDFWPGPGPRTLDLQRQGFGKVGVQICYEIIFSGQVIDRNDRPDFLFNPSNDAWFGSWGPPQHLAQARLRAIEEGLPVVRATPTGISAIIDADGRIVDSIPMHTAGRIDARMPPARAPTFFARHGNIVPVGFAMLLMLLAVAIGWRRR